MHLVRDFLLVRIFYSVIGAFLRKHKICWSVRTLSAAVLLFSSTTILEWYCLAQEQANANREHYISTTFLFCAVFLRFLRIHQNRMPGTVENG